MRVLLFVLPLLVGALAKDKDELGAADFFKRASEQLAQGHDAQALGDLRRTLAADATFQPAQYHLAATYLRLGLADKALDVCATCQHARCAEVADKAREYRALAQEDPPDDDCSLFSRLVALAPKSVDALKRRAQCYFARGSAIEALADLTLVVQTDPGDSATAAQVAVGTFVLLNQQSQALQMLRRCVSYDDTAAACRTASKQLRQLQKDVAAPPLKVRLRDVTKTAEALLDQYAIAREEDRDGALIDTLRRNRCHGLALRSQWDRAAKVCAQVRDIDEHYAPAMLVQAHLERESGSLHEALNLVTAILRDQPDSDVAPLANQLHDEIFAQQQQQQQRGPQQQPTKDLYKVLGVEPDADKKEIRRAYRQLSKQYHPDKYKGKELSEDEVMAKMQELNEAYEVLSNDDERREYDAQRSGGGGGFRGGGGFGGGGGGGGAMNEEILRRFFGGGGAFHF